MVKQPLQAPPVVQTNGEHWVRATGLRDMSVSVRSGNGPIHYRLGVDAVGRSGLDPENWSSREVSFVECEREESSP